MLKRAQLIIPNVLDNKHSEGTPISEKDLLMGLYTSRRWLWLMSPGDAIILPDEPPQDFIQYLARIQQFDSQQFNIITLKSDPKLVVSESLRDPSLLSRLKKIVKTSWEIAPFFYTPAVIDLAEKLGLSLPSKWGSLVRQNFCHRVNCKSYFRQLGIVHELSIPEGEVCSSISQLAKAIEKLLIRTGQVIVKQDFSAGGAGNIGLSANPKAVFTGIARQITLGNIEKIARDLWANYINLTNNQLIVEVYYPNQGVFTCDVYIPHQIGEPILMNYAEIRMEGNWIGGEIPAHRLNKSLVDEFISLTLKLGRLLQKEGYFGYMCSDVILTSDNQLVFTEINVRQSGFLHADTLARRLFGDTYMNQVTLLLRKDVEIGSFEKAYPVLDKAGLLFQPNQKQSGVIFLTVYASQAEFLIIAPDTSSAHKIETSVLHKLRSLEDNSASNQDQ